MCWRGRWRAPLLPHRTRARREAVCSVVRRTRSLVSCITEPSSRVQARGFSDLPWVTPPEVADEGLQPSALDRWASCSHLGAQLHCSHALQHPLAAGVGRKTSDVRASSPQLRFPGSQAPHLCEVLAGVGRATRGRSPQALRTPHQPSPRGRLVADLDAAVLTSTSQEESDGGRHRLQGLNLPGFTVVCRAAFLPVLHTRSPSSTRFHLEERQVLCGSNT